MNSPLNPALHNRLREEFGRVIISNEGSAANVTHGADMFDSRMRMRMTSAGEYYRVNCPYCNDSRARLWVNHLWGVPDNITGSNNLWLAICYNENCLDKQGTPSQLYDRVYGFKNANLRGRELVILPGVVESGILSEVSMPGTTLRLDRMPTNDPVCVYLRGRGFDPVELGEVFQVAYCLDASGSYSAAQNRIVIPVFMRGVLVGWQCRYVGDVDWKARGIPKYYNLPHMPRRLMLYNFDVARKSPYVVITEGALDVWSVGEPAVAAFGKHLSHAQSNMICEVWPNGVIIILLDGDAWDDSLKLAAQLQQRYADSTLTGKIVPVRLPPDKDPGSLDRLFLWDCIDAACSNIGINLLDMQKADIDDFGIKHKHSIGLRQREHVTRGGVVAQGPLPDYFFDMPQDAVAGT